MRLASVMAAAMLVIATTAHAADARAVNAAARQRIENHGFSSHRTPGARRCKRESHQQCYYHQGALVSRRFARARRDRPASDAGTGNSPGCAHERLA